MALVRGVFAFLGVFFLSSTGECVMSLELCVQLLCGGDDAGHRVDDKTVFCHTSVGHMAVGTCGEKQRTQKK